MNVLKNIKDLVKSFLVWVFMSGFDIKIWEIVSQLWRHFREGGN